MTVATDTKPEYEQPPTLPSPLRVYRVARNLTQAELAERAGVARITVGALERGENVPQLGTARALAAALGCDPDELFPPDDGYREADENPA
jgi:putative transcriptional regulator